MKIVVLSGSPKGAKSVTMQYVHYLQLSFPEHDFELHHVGQRIKKLERDEGAFNAVLDAVRSADGLLWAAPVYYMLVPSGYKRFIELLFERGSTEAFQGKYAAALTTSIHFYDHTAHNYLEAISDDLGMRYVTFLSMAMEDLLETEGQEKVRLFGETFLRAIEEQAPTAPRYPPLRPLPFEYEPGTASGSVDPGDLRVLVLTDAREGEGNLQRMVERFSASFARPVEVVNLRDLDIKGGCLGCMKCAYDNVCVYEGQDDYTSFYRTQVMTADIVVFAGALHDRYLSSLWKLYNDRSFFQGHTPTLLGKQMGFIVSGPLSQNANLREILTASAELNHANLVGFVTDEVGDAAQIDALLGALAERSVRFARQGYLRPATFLGVGGQILFRDAIWGSLRGLFRADHRTYKRLGWYKSFPQRNLRARAMNVVYSLMLAIPPVRRQFQERIVEGMLAPYQRLLEREGAGVSAGASGSRAHG